MFTVHLKLVKSSYILFPGLTPDLRITCESSNENLNLKQFFGRVNFLRFKVKRRGDQ